MNLKQFHIQNRQIVLFPAQFHKIVIKPSTLFPSTSGASSQSPPLSSSSGQSQPSNSAQSEVANAEASVPKAPRNDNPRTTSAGFDPEALERGAKALREIASSSQAKKVCY